MIGRILNALGYVKAVPAVAREEILSRPRVDAYRRLRDPSAWELLTELKNTAFTCASINAATCASYPPKLYVATRAGEPEPKGYPRKSIPESKKSALAAVLKSERVEEVTDHPILRLLATANPEHNQHDLFELTTLYQEATGRAYWVIDFDPFGVPEALWPLPSHRITEREIDGRIRVELHTRTGIRELPRDRLIIFRYPDPNDPYHGGLSPLRAAYESARIESEFSAFKGTVWANSGLPSVIISPKDVISAEECERLEAMWENRFTRGGQGKALASVEPIDVKVMDQAIGDIVSLAEQGFTKEQIANAFGVPISFLSRETNLANMLASRRQHAALAIRPRLRRRDDKLNERLVPLFDPSGRLYLRSDDPEAEDQENARAWQDLDVRTGVRTINEVRADRGLPPVAWGERPWLPLSWAPDDFDRRQQTVFAPGSGRNRPERPGEDEPPAVE